MRPNLSLENIAAALAALGTGVIMAACGGEEPKTPVNANEVSGAAAPATGSGHCGAGMEHKAGEAACSADKKASTDVKPTDATPAAATPAAAKPDTTPAAATPADAKAATDTKPATPAPATTGTAKKPAVPAPANAAKKGGSGSCGAGTCSAKK